MAGAMNIPPEARRRGQLRGKATQRAQFHARVATALDAELMPLVGLVPPGVLTTAAAAIWRKSYDLGYRVGFNSARRQRVA